MTEEIKKLKELIDGTDNIVFFGGAGVSTESGIPDFRSVDGLYHQQWDNPPETILSHTYYECYPEKFFAFYHDFFHIFIQCFYFRIIRSCHDSCFSRKA